MKPFDPIKPVQTRDGRKARIICTDKKGDYPIVALISYEGDDFEKTESYTNSGSFGRTPHEHLLDLVNIPVKKEGWINVYKDGSHGNIYARESDAFEQRRRDFCACIHIEWEE